MTALFSATLFLSAALLFWVQPMIAKMLLPLLGGGPSVWNTCMVFFQAMLLGGYAYAHFVSVRLSIRWQVMMHFCLLSLAALALPLEISEKLVHSLTPEANPLWWLLGALLLVAGPSFFAIAGTGPLLQKWFSNTGHVLAKDPYFLYSASNLGSLISLLGYPVLLESHLRLREQSLLWTSGYFALALLILFCGASVWRFHQSRAGGGDNASRQAEQDTSARAMDRREIISGRQRLRWLAFAFVPSSLMLGVTSYLATDIASIPLLWIVPLSIYLLSFVLVFGRRRMLPMSWLKWLLPMGALGVTFQILTRGTHPIWLVISIHLLFLFLAAMVCHGRLAAERPDAVHLTAFYFWISLGGAFGGIFNALAAPNLFSTVIEYPAAIVLACLLRPARETGKPALRPIDFALAVLLGIFTAALAVSVPFFGLESVNLRNAVIVGLPAITCFLLVDRPYRFGLSLAGILVGGGFYLGPHGKTLHIERNFFGVSRVTLDPTGAFHYFVHGSTLHGEQSIDAKRQCEPLAYYHPTGPVGEVFRLYNGKAAAPRVAVIGLGTGATACYAEAAQEWTFYEIDPAVIRIARNTNYFSYLRSCAKRDVRVVVGDARLRLAEAPARYYGLIVLDAFSSDSIPVHLLTREALELYLSKLAEGGLMAFHISNRYLDLEPVLADLGQNMKLTCRHWDDENINQAEATNGKEQSHWVVVARQPGDLGPLLKQSRWLALEGRSPPQVWTDDFCNLLSVLKWQ